MSNKSRLAATLATVVLAAMAWMNALAQEPGGGITTRVRWTADEVRVLASMRLSQLPPLPPDPSNAVDGLPAAAALGQRLFNDVRFSGNAAVSCATCHAADRQFQDGRALARGVATGSRRTMPIVGAGHGPWLFWDGRKDSLWSQALGPLEDAAEHGGNRVRHVRVLATHYKVEYEHLFGPLPDLSRLPDDAGPLGTAAEQAAWAALDSGTRAAVSRAFANLGKAIAAYERTLQHRESRFDRYAQAVIDGDRCGQAVLTAQEVQGLRLFIGKGRCATCHNGPLFTDQHFHNTGVPPLDARRPDAGRAAAVTKVLHDEFNCLGRFSDAPAGRCEELRFIVTDDASLAGAFKTPGLRNVALRPPYMHAGQFATLAEVIDHYVQAPPAALGHSELARDGGAHAERQPIRLTVSERQDLAAFLAALSGAVVQAPPQ